MQSTGGDSQPQQMPVSELPSALPGSTPNPVPSQPVAQPEPSGITPPQEIIYGRTFKRSLAAIIDGILLSLIIGMVAVVFGAVRSAGPLLSGREFMTQAGAASGTGFLLALVQLIVNIAINYSYTVGFLVYRGATPGKMALGLVVLDTQLEKVSLSKALLRETIGKFVSSVVFGLGYVAIITDKRRQGWHDQIANTLVIEKDSLSQSITSAQSRQ